MTAGSPWAGLSNATDQQKIQAFINGSKNAGFCNTELDDFALLCAKADKDLFTKVLNSPDHVLHPLLPPRQGRSQKFVVGRYNSS